MEDPKHDVVYEPENTVYNPKNSGHMYAENKVGEIVSGGSSVTFWVTPKFSRLWYTQCVKDSEKQCDWDCWENRDSVNYWTGLKGKSESVSV